MAVREGEDVRVIARLLAGMFKTKHSRCNLQIWESEESKRNIRILVGNRTGRKWRRENERVGCNCPQAHTNKEGWESGPRGCQRIEFKPKSHGITQ